MNELTSYWAIDGVEELFASMKAAKNYILDAKSKNLPRGFFHDVYIMHVRSNTCVSQIHITLDDDEKLHFSRPIKI